MKPRDRLLKIYGCLYVRPDLFDTSRCFYCGEPSQSDDHVPALSVVDSIGTKLLIGTRLVIVPSCLECNSILGDAPLLDVEIRAAYVSGKLAERVSRLTVSSLGDDENISGYIKDQKVRAKIVISIIYERLEYLSEAKFRASQIKSVEPLRIDKDISMREARERTSQFRKMYAMENMTFRNEVTEEPELHDAHVGDYYINRAKSRRTSMSTNKKKKTHYEQICNNQKSF